jgi:YD repeat-containing protein
MSFTAIAAAAMMLYADAELPWWVPSAPWSFLPPAAQPIVPGPKTCAPGLEPRAEYGACIDDCARGSCRRVRVAQQETFRDAQGRTTGTATPDGSGGFVYRDAQGRTTGRSSTDPSNWKRAAPLGKGADRAIGKKCQCLCNDPNMKARVGDLGGDVLALSPADFGRLIAEETEKWGKVIRAVNIKAD